MLIALFALSFLGIVTLLGFKMYEVAHQKETFATKALSRFDNTVEEKLSNSKEIFEKKKRRVESFVKEELPKHTKDTMVLFVETAKKKYESLFPNIRGVRKFRTERNASPFLRDISSERERDGKGRIEESSIDKFES